MGIWKHGSWPAEDDEPTAAAVSTVILAAVAAAADASPSSIPFQLTYASELLRANRPMEALGALEAAQQRSREARLQLRRGSSSGDYSPMLSPGGGHHRRSSSRGEHRRSSSRNPPNLSVQSSSSKDSIAFGVELTLRSLVRSCLSRLDPRRLAELATMRGSSFGQSPSTRSRRESATAPPTVPAGSITPLPASIQQQPRAAAPSAATTLTDVTEFTEATSGRPTATDISEALDEPATDMRHPLRISRKRAAAHGQRGLVRRCAMRPLPPQPTVQACYHQCRLLSMRQTAVVTRMCNRQEAVRRFLRCGQGRTSMSNRATSSRIICSTIRSEPVAQSQGQQPLATMTGTMKRM